MSASATQIEVPHSSEPISGERLPIETLLAEQQTLTAVEQFARVHESNGVPAQAEYYRDLIPLSVPGNGQQYAFEVDLDTCSGCKACVSACHHMNGLESSETWRSVGLLLDGPIQHEAATKANSSELPLLQHVTTACHHCVEPGCLAGCPTNAYEKDPVTGIVRHLDDQCFGCQYCTMACPYEVPQYSHEKGIVRKCDMCHGRLAAGEAPACVQSCPNGAIKISVVDQATAVERATAGTFLPDSPDPTITTPTTIYSRKNPIPESAAAAQTEFAKPQHAHLPLVVMLTLTQMGVGGLAFATLLRWLGQLTAPAAIAAAMAAGLAVLLAGLAVAPLHLGRPHLAFRSVLGWRHSWLSREAVVFGFVPPAAGLAVLFDARPWVDPLAESFLGFPLPLPSMLRVPSEVAALLAGVAGVFCSAKIYQFCQREFWKGPRTGLKFALTALTLGSLLTAFSIAAARAAGLTSSVAPIASLFAVAMVASTAQLAYELAVVRYRGDATAPLRVTARLIFDDLAKVTRLRFTAGTVGGVFLPIAGFMLASATGANAILVCCLAFLALAISIFAELAGRYLYFAAVVPLRMPGGIG